MTGEDFWWHRIASKNGMSVQRTKAETSSTDFVRWKKFLNDEPNDFHREDWFLAQLCMEVYLLRLSFGGGKVDRKMEDYLIKFRPVSDESKPVVEKPKTPEQLQAEIDEHTKSMKAMFFDFAGLDADGTPNENGKARGAARPTMPKLT